MSREMSAALSRPLSGRPGWLVALTTPAPSPGDLRLRAAFWREYLGRTHDTISAEQCRDVYANCVAMLAQADRLERPAAPVAVLVPKRAKAASKPAAIGAEQFWSLHSEAVRAMVARHGLSWRNNVPHETVEVTLPPRLCSYVGPLGGRIKWRRDHRMPAAEYWPGSSLPDGVDALPSSPRYTGPMGDDYPSLVMIREVIAEQTMNERIKRGRSAIVAHWRGQVSGMLMPLRAGRSTRKWRLDHQQLAANCRRAMAAELARLAEIQAFSPAYPRMEA